MKIDDKFGDGQVAVCAELETHPDFQRRGVPWFRLLPCVRQVIEMDFQRIELVTWVFNRKGLPLYKRCGFRAVPGTSLLMENYLPLIIRNPVLRPYFQRHDYIKTLVNKRSYGYDHLKYHDLYVFMCFGISGRRVLRSGKCWLIFSVGRSPRLAAVSGRSVLGLWTMSRCRCIYGWRIGRKTRWSVVGRTALVL